MSPEDITEAQLDAADIDIDIESLEDLSKAELIAILTKLVSDDDSSTADSSSQSEPSDAAESAPTATSSTESGFEFDDSSGDTADSEATPDEPAESEWESTTGYERPAGLDLVPGTTILVQCGSQDDRKAVARSDLLGLSEAEDRNVLLIQYRAMDTDELERIAESARRVKVITIGCTQSVPAAVEDTVEIVAINNPNDVTRLGILATGTLDDWVPLDEQTVVSLDPLDVMFQYKTVEATFRFLHIFLGKLSSRNTISHFFVNPSSSDPQAVNTLKPLFDEVLTIDSAGVDLE